MCKIPNGFPKGRSNLSYFTDCKLLWAVNLVHSSQIRGLEKANSLAITQMTMG